jgi:hypothetical protein
VSDALWLLGQYETLVTLWAVVFCLLFRSARKGVLFSFLIGCYFFFFGAVHDWLKGVVPGSILIKYSFILPATLLGFAGFFICLRSYKRSFSRVVTYLNLLLGFLLIVEIVTLLTRQLPHQDIVKAATAENKITSLLTPCDTCVKEDIHLIVLDEYAGEEQLKEVFHYDNTPFADLLRSRGFRVIKNSKSNYNFSPISMASMFSLDYLPGVGRWPDYELVDIASPIINKNIFVDFMARQGYEINNISIFDVHQIPAYQKEFTYGARLISDHTFPRRLLSDIGYHLITNLKWQYAIDQNIRSLEKEVAKNKTRMEATLRSSIGKKSNRPQFYYTHLMLPHSPFVLDRNGRSVGLDYYLDPDRSRGIKRGYLENLLYCNKIIIPFLDTLVKASSQPPVIILMSDHGFRHSGVAEKYHFMNLNAVYFPDRRYKGFYDGLTNVNQLRVLLNNRFNQHLPLLKDSTAFLGWPGM